MLFRSKSKHWRDLVNAIKIRDSISPENRDGPWNPFNKYRTKETVKKFFDGHKMRPDKMRDRSFNDYINYCSDTVVCLYS